MPKYRDGTKSEMDSQRALLDSLMGTNRNNDRIDDSDMDFRDDRVCKYFLVGTCPNGEIKLTLISLLLLFSIIPTTTI